MKTIKKCALGLVLALAVLGGVNRADAQGTAFTYQGRLNSGGVVANGTFDFQFILFDNDTDSQAGPILTNSGVGVTNGLFTTTLNFSPNIFTGSNLDLDISVRTNGGELFSELSPRTNGSGNVELGYSAGSNLHAGTNNIYIASAGSAAESGVIRVGGANQSKTFVAGIYNTTVSGGVPVYMLANGQLGTVTSSVRFKQNIQTMNDASDVLLSLRPITYKYKSDLDPQGIPQFGLVAEEMNKVDPDLVARDAEGKIYTVRYEAVNAMLLNEFLKEHRKVDSLEQQLNELKQQVQSLTDRK